MLLTPMKANTLGVKQTKTQTSCYESASKALQWGTPAPLKSKLPEIPPFPSDLLPDIMSKVVTSEASRMDNAPPEYVAISLLVCTGSVIGNSVGIKPKLNDTGWQVSPILWGMVIGSPPMKKTPSMEVAMKFLSKCQSEYLDPLNAEKAEFASIQNSAFEIKKEALHRDAEQALDNGDNELAQELAKEISELESLSDSPRNLIINDATIEAILKRLKCNPNGILFFRDELSGWFSELQKKGREHERALYLAAFNASKTPYIVERIGRDNMTIPSLTLSILGGIQPKKLAPLLAEKHAGLGDDGLFERFQLCVYPEMSQCAYRDESPNEEAIDELYSVFHKLVTLAESEQEICEFEEEAQLIWNDWSIQHSNSLKSVSEEWQAMKGKHPALLAKLALIFHLVEEAEKCTGNDFSFSRVVRKHHLERGMDWMKYLELHLKKMMMLGTQEIAQNAANSLLKNLNKFKGTFTKQQLAQKG